MNREVFGPKAQLCALLTCTLLLTPAAGEDIRLVDNTRVNAMIDEVTPGAEPSLKVTTIDGQVQSIPLSSVITINFRGRENRMLLAGTQELRLINEDRIRGRFVRNEGDDLLVDTYCLGAFSMKLDKLKGFITMPQMGRAGRWAEELLEDNRAVGREQFLDQVIDRRGLAYPGVVRKFSQEGVEIDHDAMLKAVPIPTLYLAGGRLAPAGQKPGPAFPTDVLLRVTTRDGSRMDGWVEKIALGRWDLHPVWDPKAKLSVDEEEITAIQVLNSKRLYLSQLTPARVKESTLLAPPQPYRMDRSCQGDVLSIGSHTYPWGIGVHADSDLTFRIGKAFKTFQAVTGIDSHSGDSGSVVFSVCGDGRELYKGPVLRGSDPEPHEISVSVEGVEELTLKVDKAGELDLGDMANWAAAQLLR